MYRSLRALLFVTAFLLFVSVLSGRAQAQKADQPVQQAAAPAPEPTAAEISKKETVASALMRTFEFAEYQFRSAAEAMPAEKYDYRPTANQFAETAPAYGPKALRTFGAQVKHVACANFAFSAELDGKTPPPDCDKDEPASIKTRSEILNYLRGSFAALKKSLNAIAERNKFDPIEGPYDGPNTRLGLAVGTIHHVGDHYGQLVIYLRMNGIVPPASRPNPPELHDKD